ncbi:Venom carboxylesterase-6 [Orchesella cincta]|uniref:Carboxylic ester hydrolase n=1 Tax=Orchesella cincta TaxID=48709 RepID=A0A1D2NNN9_ORCCI|nr:Venom carboxylesterase-6 [Orchesella cincta]
MNDLLGVSMVVDTTSGAVRGKTGISRNGRVFMEYLGIPYGIAERFEPPQSPEPWPGIRDALNYGSQCLQIEFFTSRIVGDENCLFINLFRPVIRETNEFFDAVGPRLLPVLVFIHGGYFMSGSSNSYRPEYFMDEDVVLITFNYRVGAFGFLNTGDEFLRGNQGLKDQVLALKWVQNNVRNFGGDPNRVTIFGSSAGGASVHYHMLSRMSKHLFSRAISQSGTAIKVWSFARHPREQAKRLATKLGCPWDKPQSMVDCLKSMDALKIVQTHLEYRTVLLHPLAIYAPSVEAVLDENTFLSDEPLTLMKNGGIVNNVPWLTGVNAEDGLIYSARIIRNKRLITEIEDNWYETAPKLLGYGDNDKKELTSQITEYYFGPNPALDFNWAFQNFTNLFSDRLYNTATHIAIQEHSKSSPVYAYYYNYRGKFSFSNLLLLTGQLPPIVDIGISLTRNFIRRISRLPKNNLGVCHGDEILMLFNLGVLSNVHKAHRDYDMSKSVVKLWTDFACGENNLVFRNVTLERVNPLGFDIPYLKMDAKAAVIGEPFADRVRFGESLQLF